MVGRERVEVGPALAVVLLAVLQAAERKEELRVRRVVHSLQERCSSGL